MIANSLHPDEMEFTHAGVMETAGVLAYDPALVHVDRAGRGDPGRGRRPGPRSLPAPRRLPDPPRLRRIAPTGGYGHPDRVSAERAAEIFDEVADHVVARAAEVWEALES